MRLALERTYPFIMASVCSISYACYAHFRGDVAIKSPREFLSMVNDVNAIFVGFLMTTIGVVWSIQDRPAIIHQKQAGTYKYLIKYLISAAMSSLISVLMNLTITASIEAGVSLTGRPYTALISSWIFLHLVCVFGVIRVIRTFGAIAMSDAVIRPKR